MTVNLKWILILSMTLAALSFLVGAGSQFTDLGLPPAEVKAIIALFVLLLGIGNSINSVLTAFGMNKASVLSAAHSLPIEDRAESFASDPQVAKVVLKSAATANNVESDKVVGPGQ